MEIEGYEADDLIGTLSARTWEKGVPCLVVTGDQDALQLAKRGVDILLTRKGISETEKYTDELVMEKWEVYPERLVDVKGLMGDASDNIPGVPGIGRKTAIKLVKAFGALEDIYERIDEDTPERHRDQAFLSRSLGTIVTKLDIPSALEDFRYDHPQKSRLLEIYQDLEFTTFARELGSVDEETRLPVNNFSQVMEQVEPGDSLAVLMVVNPHHPMWAEVIETYLCWRDEIYVLPGKDTGLLKPILEDERVDKYLHDAKKAMVVLGRRGIKLRGVAGDTLLLSYVVDPSFEGESLQDHLFHYWGRVIEQDKFPEKTVGEIINLHSFLLEKCAPELLRLYREVELPLSRVLAEI